LVTIRKAALHDAPILFELINHYAAEQIMLHRTLPDLYENVWEFTVAEEDDRVIGCGALKFYSQETAEIRSLCVDSALKSHGVGRMILDALLDEAERYGLKSVFALTVAPAFFGKLGFREVPRERFPTKVWRDCLQCQRYYTCNEITMTLELAARPAMPAETRLEPDAVPAK
jgi:amino-acid N-acetyltransferase